MDIFGLKVLQFAARLENLHKLKLLHEVSPQDLLCVCEFGIYCVKLPAHKDLKYTKNTNCSGEGACHTKTFYCQHRNPVPCSGLKHSIILTSLLQE